MENTTSQENPTVVEKIAKVTTSVGTDVIEATKTVAQDSAQVLAETAHLTVEAGHAAVQEISAAGEELARRVRATPAPSQVTGTVPAVADAAAVTSSP